VASLITTDIIRYHHPGTSESLRSHVLHPQSDITIICIIWSARENVTSVVEDHLLETISSTEWKHGEEDSDFSFVTEKYNHFLSNLAVADEETVRIILAVERDGHLMVSSIGVSEVILQEQEAIPTNIHEDTRGHHRFELISSGEIPMNSSVFISSMCLEDILGDSFYSDSAHTESAIFSDNTKEILSREVGENIHLIRIHRSQSLIPRSLSTRLEHRKISQFKEYLSRTWNNVSYSKRLRDFREYSRGFFQEKQNILLTLFFIFGVIIFFWLISYLINALFSVTSSQSKNDQIQLSKAKTLIESSQKLVSNPVAFDASMKEAEKILRDLDEEKLFTANVQDYRNKIEALKKEIYDIQTVDLSKKTSLVPFDSSFASPLWIYEKEKKLYILGKDRLISDYAIWDTNLKIKSYPSWERARDYSVLEDGNFYILTESSKILASRKNTDISYVNVTGQEWWENADGISTFNNNIYLWNSIEGSVYKHKPWLNWFSSKSPVLANPSPWIVDVGIDWGFYILKNDQKIIRLLSSNGTQTGITLNKVPGEYSVWKKVWPTRVVVRPELNYIYILDGTHVWIFLPDSKRFQDIRSWTYIAQIELSTQEEILDIAVARDGLFYALTDKWVYDVVFEFVDNNIILRS
jgi:hypothetical protein